MNRRKSKPIILTIDGEEIEYPDLKSAAKAIGLEKGCMQYKVKHHRPLPGVTSYRLKPKPKPIDVDWSKWIDYIDRVAWYQVREIGGGVARVIHDYIYDKMIDSLQNVQYEGGISKYLQMVAHTGLMNYWRDRKRKEVTLEDDELWDILPNTHEESILTDLPDDLVPIANVIYQYQCRNLYNIGDHGCAKRLNMTDEEFVQKKIELGNWILKKMEDKK